MSAVYKTQGQNAQRLLAINETLREREESARVDTEGLRLAREEIAQLRRKVEQHSEQMAEKDRVIQVSTVSSLFRLSCRTYFSDAQRRRAHAQP